MARGERVLTWRAGGWVLLLAAALAAFAAVWWVAPLLRARGSRAIGDGRDVASYGFDLSPCLVPRPLVAASGAPKDGIPALVHPSAITAEEASSSRPGEHGRYLVSDDRVVGVETGGEARAYPLRILNWHEVVNDELGGTPIAVTYNPLSEGVAVFDRTVGNEVLEFGVSGLLFDSNLLMYDRRRGGRGESLWSQLQARAVSGPAAADGRVLRVLPCSVARWADWRRALPGTSVLAPPDPGAEKYRRDPYGTYFSSSRMVAPVEPYPPPDRLPPKSRVLAVGGPDGIRVVSLEPEAPPSAGLEEIRLGSATVTIDYGSRPASVLVRGSGPVRTLYAFWFAWYATHAGDVPDSGPDRDGRGAGPLAGPGAPSRR